MATFKVANYNEYPNKHIITVEVEAQTVTEALDIAENYANNWNKESEIKPDPRSVNMIFCNGFIRNV